MNNKQVFKPYNQDQLTMLPPSLEELIPQEISKRSYRKMDISPLLESYQGGGTSSYHPKVLLKVIVYAYSQKIYLSGMIAKSLRENINFMWLSGGNHTDFWTINRFRSSRLKETVNKVLYCEQEEILEKRNSYSKTEQDATFIRMKDDVMMNGQLKAGYNIQMGTKNQFIIGWSINQNPGDTSTMINHLEKIILYHANIIRISQLLLLKITAIHKFAGS